MTVEDPGRPPNASAEAPPEATREEPLDPDTARVIDLLWKPPRRPRRGPKPALSVAQIVDAAVEIADAEGLGAVSMARVASELGYSPMALYRYVGSKDDLLMLMTEAAAPVLPELPIEGGWRVKLGAWIRSQVTLALERPWYLDLPLTIAPAGPTRLRWMDRGFDALAGTGLSFDEKVAILGVLALHGLGLARIELDIRRAAVAAARRQAGVDEDTPEESLDPELVAALNPYADFEHVIASLATPEDFPAIHAAIGEDVGATAAAAASTADTPPTDADLPEPYDDLTFSIDIMLDGIEALIARRASQQGT